MLLALTLTLLSQRLSPCGPEGPVFCSTAQFAFFEFAPSSGTGMTAACACTTPTGAKGETLTFTRASSATCLKGATTTGIANGDMTTCTNDQPRVMPGDTGTGANGLLVEGARTNSILRSQELDNAAWTAVGSATAPTVTANAAVAPDGTTTAERVQVAACPGGGSFSVVQQNYTGTAAAWAGTMFFKGNGTSGNIALYYFDSTATAGTWVSCPFVSTGWSRCEVDRTFANITHRLGFGCNNDTGVFPGSSNTGAVDVFAWGADSEAGALASSYIATTAAAVTRATEDTPYVTISAVSATTYSMAATISTPKTAATTWAVLTAAEGGAAPYRSVYNNAVSLLSESLNGTAVTSSKAGAGGLSVARVASYADTNQRGFLDGVAFTSEPVGARTVAPTRVYLGGSFAAGYTLDAVIKRVCYQPNDSTRCR